MNGVSIAHGFLEDDQIQLETDSSPIHLYLEAFHYSALKPLDSAKQILETVTSAAVNNHKDSYISRARIGKLVEQANSVNLA